MGDDCMNILVIDVGTSSMRGLLFDQKGNILFKEQKEYQPETHDNIAVEQDPAILRNSLNRILKAVGEYSKTNERPIQAISVTAQRSSVIAVDEKGAPLCHFMMWQDKRSAEICEEKNQQIDTIYSICGMRATPVFSAPKILWIKRNRPDIYKNAYRFMGIHEYVLFALTGKFVTDTSIASRTCLFDIQKKEWSEKLIEIFELDREKLCDIVPVGSICGYTVSNLLNGIIPEGLPVISAGGDQQCAALGLGVIDEGSVEVNAGTGSFIIASSDRPLFDPNQRLICNVSAIPNKWIVEGATLAAGIAVNWMNGQFYQEKDQSYLFEKFDRDCAESPVGANGVIFTPAFSGKGAPYWDPYARANLQNIGFHNTRADFARALLEGIASEMNDCLNTMNALFQDRSFQFVRCAGGLTKSDLFNQIQADMYGIPVMRPKSQEATGLGAWISAAVCLNLYKDYNQALQNAVQDFELRSYQPKAENHKLYQKINAARLKFYQSVNMKEIHDLLA